MKCYISSYIVKIQVKRYFVHFLINLKSLASVSLISVISIESAVLWMGTPQK